MLKREITKIILELKQIKLLLKNKNSIEVDDNTGQIASTVQGNQIQNNYFGYRSFIPLNNYDNNINARFVKYTRREKIENSLKIIIPMFIMSIWINNLVGSLFFISLFAICFYFIIFFQIKKDKAYIKINENSLIFTRIKTQEIIEINFEDIRSFAMEWDFMGYQFYIYPINEIEPKIQFSVDKIHAKLAIDELLSYKINNNKKIKKEEH
jgi:hypothetical protein